MKKAIFKTGQKVRYKGNRIAESGVGFDPVMVPSIYPDMIAEITETHPTNPSEEGFRKNGHNVYTNEYGYSEIIWPHSEKDWEVVK